MKKLYIIFLAFFIATVTSCTYSFPEPEVPTAGTADFTKVVAVGNSLTAGYMNGALYDAGQAASFANLVAQQIHANGGGVFNQPDIAAPDGDYGNSGGAFGRLHLVNPLSPAPAPIVPGQPITAYSGDKTALNNFGIPGMRIVDVAFPGYGTLNGYFGRFASDPATATVLGDAIAANGSFIMFWLGSNDVLGYATNGATGDDMGDGTNPGDMTDPAIFDNAYNGAVAALITTDGKKGIVANIPNVQDIPHFTTVAWNAIEFDTSDPVDAGTIAALNAGYAIYNGTLDQLVLGSVITQEEADNRKIEFANGANGIVIFDTALTDLTGIDPALLSMRMANSNDLITLSAGAVLGTLADPNNPQSAIGVAVPLDEKYTLIQADQVAIADRITSFNGIIKSVVDGSGGSLALLDINTIFLDAAQNGVEINGSTMNVSISPAESGGFSLDGVHPNPRGAAWVASLFIDKINEVFGSNIPNINPNDYVANELPVL